MAQETTYSWRRLLAGIGWMALVAGLGLIVGEGLLMTPVILTESSNGKPLSVTAVTVFVILGLLVMLGTFAIAEAALRRHGRGALRQWRQLFCWQTLLAMLIGIIEMFATGMLTAALKQGLFHTTTAAANQAAIEKSFFCYLPLNLLVIVIIGPILEEYIFRGLLMTYFSAKRAYWPVVVSGLLFGWAHQGTITSGAAAIDFCGYALGGVVLAALYRWRGDLKVVMLTHMTSNLVVALCMVYMR